jgi:hypothetical protein
MVRDEKAGLQITLQWVKAHAGTRGTELADAIAKKAATKGTIPKSYTRIPKSVVLCQLEEESLQMWQRSWTQTTKGGTTKEYFPHIEGRIKLKLNHTENLTTILSGHGNIKAYLKRFQNSDDSTCPCGKVEQTTDHIICDCDRLSKERDKLKAAINKTNT